MCHHSRILLFERTCRSIARIGKKLLSRLLTLGIQAIKRGVWHKYLTANLEQRRHIFSRQFQRNSTYRAHICRYIITRTTIATRYRTCQSSLLVGQRDRRAIELQFANILNLSHFALDTLEKFVQLLDRIGIAEREHRIAMLNRTKFGRQVATYATRRRIGIVKFGVLGFEALQLVHTLVELVVAHLGGIVDIIFSVMVVEPAAQLFDLLLHRKVNNLMNKVTIFVGN